MDYVFGLLIERFRDRWQSKLFLTLAAVITLSSLALFKYSSFFSENVNSLFSLNLPSLKLALPIGISFLYLSGTYLCYRRIPRQRQGAAVVLQIALVCVYVPAADSRTHS